MLVLAATMPWVKARDWRDVVDPGLYEWVDLDPKKLIVMAEMDPFAVSFSPTMTPTYAPEVDVVERPTTPSPTDLPTLAPTEVWAMVDQNGGCEKDQVLHEIRMTDSWGDGWDETIMTITRLVDQSNLPGVVQMEKNEHRSSINGFVEVRDPQKDDPSFPFQVYRGSLAKGTEGFSYICLQRNQCYQVSVDGGFWQQEIAWGIRQVQLGVPREKSPDSLLLAKGEAPEICQISVADKETGEHACPITCGVRTGNPTAKPTFSPTSNPTAIRNAIPDDKPPESSAPSDMPSLVPTSRDDEDGGDAAEEGQQDKEGAGAGQIVSSVPSDTPSLVPTGAPSDENRIGGGGFGNGGGGFGFSGGF